jgi:hypothetical protein
MRAHADTCRHLRTCVYMFPIQTPAHMHAHATEFIACLLVPRDFLTLDLTFTSVCSGTALHSEAEAQGCRHYLSNHKHLRLCGKFTRVHERLGERPRTSGRANWRLVVGAGISRLQDRSGL